MIRWVRSPCTAWWVSGPDAGADYQPLTEDGGASFSGQLIARHHLHLVFVASLVVWGVLKAVMGIRVSEEEEYEGVDLAECGMEAYPEFTNK